MPTLVPQCPPLYSPDNGALSLSSSTSVGSIASYSCTLKYELVGPKSRTCQADETWTDVEPICKKSMNNNVGSPPTMCIAIALCLLALPDGFLNKGVEGSITVAIYLLADM